MSMHRLTAIIRGAHVVLGSTGQGSSQRFFASELVTTCGHSIHQAAGPLFGLFHAYLSDRQMAYDSPGRTP